VKGKDFYLLLGIITRVKEDSLSSSTTYGKKEDRDDRSRKRKPFLKKKGGGWGKKGGRKDFLTDLRVLSAFETKGKKKRKPRASI